MKTPAEFTEELHSIQWCDSSIVRSLDTIKAQIAAAVAARDAEIRAESEWQPIETAPKDGTYVDMLDVDGVRHIVCDWDGKSWTNDDLDCVNTPTHWSPIPKGPTP